MDLKTSTDRNEAGSLSVGFKTDVGRKRESNQDSYAVLRRHELYDKLDGLFVVADGMGGMGGPRGGNVASSIVAQTVPETLHERLLDEGKTDPARLLNDAIVRSNAKVWMRAVENRELRGMGTTCVAAIILDGELTLGNAGDSRAYLLRGGVLSQISEDHSAVWKEVKSGNMTREEAQKSRFRNNVTKAVGIKPELRPDIDQIPLEAGDTLLLCSDGLTAEVSDKVIARILASEADPQSAADKLVATAVRNGGSDNVTVVVVRYGAFTPLALPESGEDEDTPTDPEQDWRRETVATQSRPSAAPVAYDEDDEVEEAPRRYQQAARYDEEDYDEDEDYIPEAAPAAGVSGLALTLLVILLVVALAEAGALVIALKNRTVAPPPAYVPIAESTHKVTDDDLNYGEITPMLKQSVRDMPLQMDADDNLYVVTMKDGLILRVTNKGVYTPIGATEKPRSRASEEATAPKSALPLRFVFDPSAHRYQINTQEACIDKFTGSTRIAQIGQGLLKKPTDLAVDRLGNLYVIDNHKLVKIEAIPPLATQRHRSGDIEQ